ncbi:thiazole biosynthesis protein [Candidatus Erwinia haradaeae]|uniref:tRNA sulfurtransferase, partial n=1 Tax=Candidatus Erwinia haradaeae TaxID=1922217 RepID=A0A451D9F0_9GAMM|nr:thiazole biosynthesis protein [Candidatus Erwinia haradaeae]VFP82907.1 tRNA sulfurtransferase [Candidatus Erwinia haradaeae]
MPYIHQTVLYNDKKIKEIKNITNVKAYGPQYVVLDIRAPDEQKQHPLSLDNMLVKSLPFYKLSSQFSTLDQKKYYLLYCEHGIMSRLQTILLNEKGFKNVQAYRSTKK